MSVCFNPFIFRFSTVESYISLRIFQGLKLELKLIVTAIRTLSKLRQIMRPVKITTVKVPEPSYYDSWLIYRPGTEVAPALSLRSQTKPIMDSG